MQAEESIYYVNQIFEKSIFPLKGTKDTQFEGCNFKNYDFTGINFSSCNFANTTFEDCNFSMIKFGYVGLDNVHFVGCKMVGSDFSTVKDFLFHVNFSNCILDYAAFMKKKNRKCRFENCSLKGTDFSEADLTESIFDRCDLSNAVFMNSMLNSANFATSFNFTIDPERNLLRKAKFSTHGLVGLLTTYGIIVTEN
ncbi:pentapeptide repeat-containing protein [Pedobacter sp. Du54]|uniref:pentapeptide repeat-containing protein n=1 Tax=Pedobacter anseongensis TaxID=3133439 RepID=UPI0030AAEA3D